MSDKDWTLSYLSSVAGQVPATSGEGLTTRLYAWGADDVSDYWLRFIVDDNGKLAVLIDAFIAPSEKMYAVIGYCEYHDIDYALDETLTEEVCDECREKAH